MSEWTPAGVLTNFENRSGAGVDLLRKGPESGVEPELFFECVVSLLIADYYYCRLFFYKGCYNFNANVKNYFTGSPKF